MVVGVIDHATGTRDIRRLAWLGQRSRAAADHRRRRDREHGRAATVPRLRRQGGRLRNRRARTRHSAALRAISCSRASSLGSVFTTIYSLRFPVGVRSAAKGTAEPSKRVAADARPPSDVPRPAWRSWPPRVWCSALWPRRLDDVLDTYADTVPGGERLRPRAVARASACRCCCRRWCWPIGTAAYFGRARLRAHCALIYQPLGNADRIYDAVLRGADLSRSRLTGFTQRGSIPATQSVILSTLVLRSGDRPRARAPVTGPSSRCGISPLQVVVGLLDAGRAALGATVMRNRLAAVLLVGVTGYGCGTIFAFHGAPDLALTQFLVETLTLVIFVLVLRTLPAGSRQQPTSTRYRLPRAALALAVGATVTTLAVYAMAARTGTPIAALLPDAAYFRGHGANTVNVLLVDIRAWDTMGEISVLLVAATGVASYGVPAQAFWRRAARLRRWSARHRPACRRSQQPGRRRRHLAARQRTARPTAPVAGARGRHTTDLPAHHGAVGVLLLRAATTPPAAASRAGSPPGWRWCCGTWRAAVTNSARRCRWTRARSSALGLALSAGTGGGVAAGRRAGVVVGR